MEDVSRFTLRLPEPLKEEITDEAKANMRSLHAEILVLLQEALRARKGETNPKEDPALV